MLTLTDKIPIRLQLEIGSIASYFQHKHQYKCSTGYDPHIFKCLTAIQSHGVSSLVQCLVCKEKLLVFIIYKK